ncbi:Cof subfamily protein (haloacid dehalogenase superfamily) [Peribacillus deserti]|uniref:Cof subfamily protein (Haloacid dehalogenase superfamily) n=1 Tax=Peribacillus deserti TaxID=673318 RepID=A0ABS2QH10_9BACI|nr:Cof-type HAD-IIB family hydrolase [Peribacillus deserti]MBM7692437.1 Cof subfamily protein (haloacid dehalogenase superfamily) [Peribacillus deserti]
MKKIVFFDIDGTILDHEKKIPDSTREAIKTLQQNGVYVAIATGRAPFMFDYIREELDIETFVSFNGQYVVFENEVVYKNPLHTAELERLHQSAEKAGHSLVFMNEKTMKASVKHSSFIEESLGTLNFPHPEKDTEFYTNREIYQTLLFCEPKDEMFYHQNHSFFRYIRWHELAVDVLPKGASKAEGIKSLMDRIGFKLEDVYAFGDGLNDIEMLGTVGHGVAMGNAINEVKKHAAYVTSDVSEDGIFQGLKKLKLI